MTRVLWVTPYADPHMRSGGALRTVQLIRELAGVMPVDLLVVGHPTVDVKHLSEVTGTASVRWLPGPQGVAARALALRRRWPLAVARMWNPAAATIVREHPTSVVVAEHSQAAVYRPRSRAYVLHLQNADVVRLREQPRSPHLVPRMHQRWELATLPAWERRAVRDPLARVVAVSRADAEALGLSATVIPNGTRLHPPRQLPPGGGVLFVGALDYMPNEAGLTWWAENVWPKLPSGFPPLTVVGRGGRSALGRLSNHPGLDVVGEVSDLVPFYQQAALVVVPLLHGSGTRLKVLEAMAWSVPVLSTTKGAEGLDLVPNRDFAVADTAMEFARRAVALMSDLEQRRSLGLAGRTAAEPYSWSGLGEALRDLVRKVDADLRA